MHLLEPFPLSTIELPNRVVLAAPDCRRASAGGLANAAIAGDYAQRAGAGLIISELIEVDPHIAPAPPTRPALCNLAQTRSWRDVVARVHASGGRIFAQLSHPGRLSHPALRGGRTPIAPSRRAAAGLIGTPDGAAPMPVPHALAQDEIPAVIEQFADAASYALAAGFDGVELHAAGGFLIDQFLRADANLRHDAYGGSAARRARFLLEVVEAVAVIWGVARVGVRLSPRGTCNEAVDTASLATFGHVAAALDQIGIAYLHVVERREHRPSALARVRRHFGGAVIAGGCYTRDEAEALIAAGLADCVAFGKIFATNPDLPERFRHGAALAATGDGRTCAADARG